MYPNRNIKAMWKLAEFTDVLMTEEFIFQINKDFSEDERFVLALFSKVHDLLRIKAKLRKISR